jgi:hypothetical protein
MSDEDEEIRGWDVFISGYGLVIQRDDEAGMYDDDHDAVRQACKEAAHGDEFAREALICCCTQDDERWAKFLKRRKR